MTKPLSPVGMKALRMASAVYRIETKPGSPVEDVQVPADEQDIVAWGDQLVKTIDQGYELQIAMDQLTAGSTDALKTWFARQKGLDPDEISLVSEPWNGEGHVHSFVGKLDNIRPPDNQEEPKPGDSQPAPHVAFKDTEAPFEYSPLDPERRQFRLLRLAPPDENGIITHFQLDTFDIDDAPPYFCLSYVWGDPWRFPAVNANGGMIPLTQNLYHALTSCFNKHPESWLWADGICINQGDLAERSQQVLLMGKIYQNASMVLAHPGHYNYRPAKLKRKERRQETTLEDRLGGLGVQDRSSSGNKTSPQENSTDADLEYDFDVVPEKPYALASFYPKSINCGHSSRSAQRAISIMTFLTRTWLDSDRNESLSDKEWDKLGLPDPDTDEGKETWTDLVAFWFQDWYFRTWVLQEVVLAKKVVVLYDETAISLQAIMDFWSLARQHFLPRPLRIGFYADKFNRAMHLSVASSLKALRDRREGKIEKAAEESDRAGGDAATAAKPSMPSLVELLVLSRNNLATDPRDKVYGLLGLTDDTVAESIIPDYSQANDAAKVFTDVATKTVNAGQATDLLHHAGVHQSIPGLPSWVPDWTMQSRSTLPVHLYQSMGKTSPKVSILGTWDRPKLIVRGAIISRINDVGSLAWKFYSHDLADHPFGGFKNAPDIEIPAFSDEDAKCVILGFASFKEEYVGERYSEEGFGDAVARTLAVDCSWKGQRIGRREARTHEEKALTTGPYTEEQSKPSVSAEFFAGVEAFKKFYAKEPESEEDLTAPGIRVHETKVFRYLLDFDRDVEADIQKRMVPFTVPFQEAQRGRRFAILGTRAARVSAEDVYDTEALQHHFMGTVPWNTESEDYVVLLEGFRTPFVLRRSGEGSDGNDEFTVIGDCYVHGVMDGELLTWADEVDEKLEPDYVSKDEEGREYAVRAPEGFVPFADFTLI